MYLSEQKLEAVPLAGSLGQDVDIHAAAVDDLGTHPCRLQGLSQPRDDLLRVVPLCCEVVAQLVRALLTWILHRGMLKDVLSKHDDKVLAERHLSTATFLEGDGIPL